MLMRRSYHPPYSTLWDLTFFSIGDVDIDKDDIKYSTVAYENQMHKHYKSLNFENDSLIGGIIIGDNSKSKLMIEGIREGRKIQELIGVFG